MSAQTGKTVKKAAVVGNPISHSLSPQLHTAGWGAPYFIREHLEQGKFAEYLNSRDTSWIGLAVTMPFKFAAVQTADIVDGLAKSVGAANTIVFQPTGPKTRMSVAFNTDVAGIVNAIREVTDSVFDANSAEPNRNSISVDSSRKLAAQRNFPTAAILGSGATASSALAAVIQLGAQQVTVCARKSAGPNTVFAAAHRLHLDLNYQHIASENCVKTMSHSELVISTLPAGAADSAAEQLAELLSNTPSPETALAEKILLDVVYEPNPTQLMQVWTKHGGTVVPGWLMLLHQAIDQARLLLGKHPISVQCAKH
ncbi:shikimate dehydrogenase [Arcanobacterium hippocoleae]